MINATTESFDMLFIKTS